MEILACKGHELEKAQSNTSEDFFNRSEVTYVENGQEKTFHLLYVRYFDELFSEFTPFEENPVISIGEKTYAFCDLVALVALIKNPGYQKRKRVYINELDEFKALFEGIQWEAIQQIFIKLADGKSYQLESAQTFFEAK